MQNVECENFVEQHTTKSTSKNTPLGENIFVRNIPQKIMMM